MDMRFGTCHYWTGSR